MPVIINEMDVSVDAASQSRSSAQETTPPPAATNAPQPVSLQDLHDMMRRQAERLTRVWAH